MDADRTFGFQVSDGSTEIALRRALLEFELALLKEGVLLTPELRKLLEEAGQGFTATPKLEEETTTGSTCGVEEQSKHCRWDKAAYNAYMREYMKVWRKK